MTWDSMNGGLGKIRSEMRSFPEGTGRNKVIELFSYIPEGFAKECKMYWAPDKNDLPFIYAERQMLSALFPAVHKVADRILLEQPLEKKHRGPEGTRKAHGWLDFWIEYRKVVVLLEAKHAWVNQKTSVATSVTKDAWEKCHEQVKDIVQHSAKQLEPQLDSWVAGMMVLVHYQNNQINYDPSELWNTHVEVRNTLDPISNISKLPLCWSACWKLPEDMSGFTTQEEQKYPAVSFFVATKPIKL